MRRLLWVLGLTLVLVVAFSGLIAGRAHQDTPQALLEAFRHADAEERETILLKLTLARGEVSEAVIHSLETGEWTDAQKRDLMELLFKLWKSHNGLGRVRVGATSLPPLAVFYAKLLGVVLQHWLLWGLVWRFPQRSLLRAAKRLREWWKVVVRALGDVGQLHGVLRELQRLMERLDGVKERLKKPSHAQLLEDPELLEWLT